ncbi:unnamed protein product [Lampetra fluviatilis]
MAAYPETEPDLLEPLILGKMLEFSKDLAIPLPVCSHEPLTSRLVAKCLDAQFNLHHWAQMVAWTGDPAIDGKPIGWTPSKVVFAPDDAGPGDLTAAAGQWVPQRRMVPRSVPSSAPRRDGAGAGQRADMACY